MIYPKEIILEITNHCNLRCRFCHFHGEKALKKRKKGFISSKIWQTVFKDLSSLTKTAGEVTLCLHGAGESLLHPEFRKILLEARKIPCLKLGFMTNAMLLDSSWAQFLVSLPVDWLWFSVDGATPETNDYYRRGARLEVIEKNIFTLIEEKERKNSSLPLLYFNMVAYPSVTSEEIEIYVNRWLPYAQGVSISRFRPISSKRLLTPEERQKIKEKPCPLLYRQMVISWEGELGLCCEDIHVEFPLGRVGEVDLLTLFNSLEMQSIRKAHEEGRRTDLYLCHDCDVWAAEEILSVAEKNIKNFKAKVIKRPSGIFYERV